MFKTTKKIESVLRIPHFCVSLSANSENDMAEKRGYAIGMQDFPTMIQSGGLYIDSYDILPCKD